MCLLVIDRKNTKVEMEAKHLIIRVDDRRPQTVPLNRFSHVVLNSGVALTTGVLLRLARDEIAITILDASRQQALYPLIIGHGNVERRVKQTLALHRPSLTTLWSQQLVNYRVRLQRAQLRRWHCEPLLIESLGALIPTIQQADSAQLLGIEGSASRFYFKGMQSLVGNEWHFTQRNRRPPLDPVNALLSLTYTLITGECTSALQKSGLDSTQGFYHKVSYNRPAAACDLVECLRCKADSWVLSLLTDYLTPDDFEYRHPGCYLKKSSRSIFYQQYACKSRRFRHLAEHIAQAWVRELDALTLHSEEVAK